MLDQTPLESRTKGQGPLHLSELLQPASTSTPNRFHRLLLTSQNRQPGNMGVAERRGGRQGGAQGAVPSPLGVPPPQPAPAAGRLRCGRRTSALGLVTSRCHTRLQQGKTGSPMSLETKTPSEKPAGETDGELLGCEGTRLCNGGGARRHGAAPAGGCLATCPAAAAPALRPGRQRSAGGASPPPAGCGDSP